MDYRTRASDILKAATDGLRSCINDAAAAGDYDAVAEFASCAKALRSAEAPIHTYQSSSGSAGKQRDLCRTPSLNRPPSRVPPRAISSSKAAPQFFRGVNSLVKVGRSRKKNAKYEHRAPLAALNALVSALSKVDSEEKLISMQDLAPINTPDGSEVPSYQAYLCLAFLKSMNLIEQHGRSGYTVREPVHLRQLAENAYKGLNTA